MSLVTGVVSKGFEDKVELVLKKGLRLDATDKGEVGEERSRQRNWQEDRPGGRDCEACCVTPEDPWADTVAGAQGLGRRVTGAIGVDTLHPLE